MRRTPRSLGPMSGLRCTLHIDQRENLFKVPCWNEYRFGNRGSVGSNAEHSCANSTSGGSAGPGSMVRASGFRQCAWASGIVCLTAILDMP